MTGPLALALADLTLVLLQPKFDIIHQTMSALALTPDGWLQRLGFYCFGASAIVLALGLKHGMRGTWGLRLGLSMLVLSGGGMLFVATFPTIPPFAPETPTFLLHLVGSVTTVGAFPLACFLLMPSMLRERRWRPLFYYTLATGIVAGGLGISLAAGQLTARDWWPWLGVNERALLGVVTPWFVITSAWLRKTRACRCCVPALEDRGASRQTART